MAGSVSGLDPDLVEVLAKVATGQAAVIIALGATIRGVENNAQLDPGAMEKPCALIKETFDELTLLGEMLSARAKAVRAADSSPKSVAGFNREAERKQLLLEQSLVDDVGDKALMGDNVVSTLLNEMDKLDPKGEGLSFEKIQELAKTSTDPTLKAAAAYLAANPTFFAHIISANTVQTARSSEDFDLQTVDGKSMAGMKKADLVATLEQNVQLRTMAVDIEWPNEGKTMDTDDFKKMVDKQISDATGAKKARLEAAKKYIDEHPDFFARVESSVPSNRDPSRWAPADGRISEGDIQSIAINQQSFVSDPEAARTFVTTKIHNVAFTKNHDNILSIRDVKDDSLKALAYSSLAASTSLKEQAEVVAFLPESEAGTRNYLITAYYTVVGREKTQWMNASLPDPLDVRSPGHTGWDWMVIGANASNSVHDVISGKSTVPWTNGAMSIGWDERDNMARGNQQIFTDVAIRNAALMERFPAGKPVTDAELKLFFQYSTYPNGEPMFGDRIDATGKKTGDRQMRDAMLFSLAARGEKDPETRRQLNFKVIASTAIHEQASIQKELQHIMGQNWDDDGLRSVVPNIMALYPAESNEELGTKYSGRLRMGQTGPVFGLSKDLDQMGHYYPSGPIDDQDLGTDLSPTGAKSVTIDGRKVAMDGSSIGVKDIRGWKDAGFEIDPKEWQAHGTTDPDPKRPLSKTGAAEWTNFQDRMWYIANLFKLSVFDPKFLDYNKELSTDRVSPIDPLTKKPINDPATGKPGVLSFAPDNAKQTIGENRPTPVFDLPPDEKKKKLKNFA